MKMALVVHGRFHGFDLARALIHRGHDVQVMTNYPVWAAMRFGLPAENLRSCWPHGVASRMVDRLGSRAAELASPAMHEWFSKWAARELRGGNWDLIHTFSGVAEDVFRRVPAPRHFMVRGSSHIRTQRRILAEESVRVGVSLAAPGEWIVDREEREYDLCDRLCVLSQFAYRSFVEEGVPASKLAILPLGVDTRSFRPSPETLENRRQRILSGGPLQVLFTGTLNYRKGLLDFDRIVRASDPRRFQFRVVGSVPSEGRSLIAQLPPSVEFVPRQPQAKLPPVYAASDVFLFPTLEDGFAVVLTQAYANAVPMLTTTNCAGPDIISEGKTGWVLPVRSPEAFIERLRWCDRNRDQLAGMVTEIYNNYSPRDWNDVAADFESIAQSVQKN